MIMATALQAHRVETKLTEAGKLTLDHLPFPVGTTVEVIVLTLAAATSDERYPLRGTVIEYHDPFEPVAESDWEALAE